jgi:hypothetical protein
MALFCPAWLRFDDSYDAGLVHAIVPISYRDLAFEAFDDLSDF